MSFNDFLKAFRRWVSDLDWRLLLLTLPPISILLFVLVTLFSPVSTTTFIISFTQFTPIFSTSPKIQPIVASPFKPAQTNDTRPFALLDQNINSSVPAVPETELGKARIAVCLVGGARRFELTGPSIFENVLELYPNADLFLHSPVDKSTFKFSLLKIAPRIASVRIFQPEHIPETPAQARVLTADGSPNGIQGLLQYFNLVEGCLKLIEEFQRTKHFTYDWVIRTRVDGYWNAPLRPEFFKPGKYIVPSGSSYGGLNDRFGVGDIRTSTVALSRLSLIPRLDSAGFRQLNSERSFKAQLTTVKIPFVEKRLPFCIVSNRQYSYPPLHNGVPVAALSSQGPLSGAKCRPCKAVCTRKCVAGVMAGMAKSWSWTEWRNGTLELCDAHGKWERGWEREFDRVAGPKLARFREKVKKMEVKECEEDFKEVERKVMGKWEVPKVEEICRMGLGSRKS